MKAFPTALDAFRNCPRKYAFDKDPEIKRRYRKPSQAMFVGTCVHDALERFFRTDLTPVGERTYETLVRCLREAWAGVHLHGWRKRQRAEERKQVFGGDRETEAAVGEEAKHMLWGFVRTQDLTVVPFTREGFHETDLAPGRTLAGKIDRIDRLEDGSLKVVDYKTGRAKTADQLREEDIQLASYALIAGRKFRVPVSRCSMVYLKESREVGFEPDGGWLEEREEEILGLMDRIEEEERRPDGPGKFPPTPNILCGWCDYRPICEEGKAWWEAHRAETEGEAEEPPF